MSTVHRRRKSQAASFCRTNLRECLSCITAGSTNTQPRPKRSISWSAFEVNSQAWLRRDWRLSFSRKERMGQGTERALLELLSYRTNIFHTNWYCGVACKLSWQFQNIRESRSANFTNYELNYYQKTSFLWVWELSVFRVSWPSESCLFQWTFISVFSVFWYVLILFL